MTLHRLLPLLALALNLLLAGSALASGRRSPRNVTFALLALALGVWSLGVLGLRWTDDPDAALRWEWFLHVGVVAIPALFYDYVLLFLNMARRRASLTLAYGASAVFLLLVPTESFMAGVVMTPWGFAPRPGVAYAAFTVYFHAYLLAGLILLLHGYRTAVSSFRKNRILLVLIGVTVSVIGGLVDFVRFLVGWEWLYPIGIPCNAVFAVALGVAIVRYRLMDVSALVKRAVLYLGAAVTLAPLLVLALDVVDDAVAPTEGPGPATNLRHAVVLVVIFVLAVPLLSKLQDALDRVMFRRQRAVRDTLLALSKEMSATLELDALARRLTEGLVGRIPTVHASLHIVADGDFVAVGKAASAGVAPALDVVPEEVVLWLRVTRRTFVVEEPAFHHATTGVSTRIAHRLEAERVALIVPLFLETELAGMLVLGEKLSGDVFDSEEIELLELLARHTTTALKNVRLYEKLKSEMDELRTTRHLYGEAQEADRAKEQFLATLAHELRNPLSPIITALHVAGEIATEPRVTGLIAIAQRQARHLARLMEDLLDVSRIRAGKVTLRLRPVDVREIVERCFESLTTSGRSIGRDISSRLPSSPVIVHADPDRLQQVVGNLIDNALKYTPADGAIRVVVEREFDDAVIHVRDTGIGISADVLPHVFDVFTQADQQARSGLGLGLALVRALVEQHGGRVTVRTGGVGQGSEFTVRLPLRPELIAVEPAAPPAHEERRRRILVIEDNADARQTLRTLLEMAGHRVEVAGDGEEGMRRAIAFRPDVAIVDIGLPDVDGYQVARRLRAEVGPQIYLVALTGYGQPDDRRRAMESGFDAHLVKPIEPERFLHILNRRD